VTGSRDIQNGWIPSGQLSYIIDPFPPTNHFDVYPDITSKMSVSTFVPTQSQNSYRIYDNKTLYTF